jgi:peptide alpha-N-acetyltransferase
MWPMIKMIEKDLSEPYSVYTYRYFLMQWPFLCFMCYDGDKMVGCVISKMELHRVRKLGQQLLA